MFEDIFKWFVDISNYIKDIFISTEDIFNYMYFMIS